MKKTLNAVLAVILAVAMFAGFAYVATPESSNEYQISLASVKAVTVQDSVLGVRSYADLSDATKGFQVNEVIHLAVTAEVKNLEKPKTNNKYKSIADKDIKVIVGSPNIDLSVARMSNPTLLAHVWSGYTSANVATVGYVLYAGEVLKYDKAANELSWEFRGADLYSMQVNGNLSYNLVTFNPDVKNGKIVIPAIKLKDKDKTWVLGQQNFDTTYEAPESIYYTMILTGVTKDHAGAAEGEFYAKILISGAEKFVDEAKYYYSNDGNVYSNTTTIPATQKKFRDYVEVKVKLLEIKGGYNVYRYDVPASAVILDVPIIYGGGYDDFNGTTSYVDGNALAWVNTNTWDFATSKTTANKTTVNTAGGVTSRKAFATYNAASTTDVPMTSIVYSATKAYYAPGFYGGISSYGDTIGKQYGTEYAPGKLGKFTVDGNIERVDYWTLDLPTQNAYDNFLPQNVYVYQADKIVDSAANTVYAPATAAKAPLGTGATAPARVTDLLSDAAAVGSSSLAVETFYNASGYGKAVTAGATDDYFNVPQGGATNRLTLQREYTVEKVPGTWTIKVKPGVPGKVNNVNALSTGPKLNGNEWVVFYADDNHTDDLATSFYDLNMKDKLLTPGIFTASQDTRALPPIIRQSTADADFSTAIITVVDAHTNLLDDVFGSAAGALTGGNATLLATANPGTWADPTAATPAPAVQADLDALNDVLQAQKIFWPVFEEFTTNLPISDANATGITFGKLIEAGTGPYASGTPLAAVKPTGLVNLSQITEAFLYNSSGRNIPPTTSVVQNFLLAIGGTPAASNYWNTAGTGSATGIWAKNAELVLGTDGFYDIRLWDFQAPDGNGDWNPISESDLKTGPYNFSDQKVWLKLSYNSGLKNDGVVWDSKHAAPENVWDTIEETNGIVVYTITANTGDRPHISMATEKTAFESDNGFGIALFDGYNLDKFAGISNAATAHRIYRSNDSNLSYSDANVGGHVNESASMIAALRYFGLDTSFNTVFRVTDDSFTDKGSPAVYSENVTGRFKYGNLEIIGETIDEGTEVEEIVEPDETPEPEEIEPIIEPEIEPEPELEPVVVNVVRTGNASANIAIALVASAIVAAAGLAFVMKKRVL